MSSKSSMINSKSSMNLKSSSKNRTKKNSKSKQNYDVFICHSKKKKDSELFIYYLKELLTNEGYKTFIDIDDLTKITPKKIENIIKNIKVLVVVVDDICLSHRWVRDEIEYAIKYNKKIIPIENLDLYKKNDIIDYWKSGKIHKTFDEFLLERLMDNSKPLNITPKKLKTINENNKQNKLIKLDDGSYWLESAVISWKLFVNQVLPFTSSYRTCFKNKLIKQIKKPLSPTSTIKTFSK